MLIEHFFIHTVELLARQHREKLPAEIERFLNGAVIRLALVDEPLLKNAAEFHQLLIRGGKLILTDYRG